MESAEHVLAIYSVLNVSWAAWLMNYQSGQYFGAFTNWNLAAFNAHCIFQWVFSGFNVLLWFVSFMEPEETSMMFWAYSEFKMVVDPSLGLLGIAFWLVGIFIDKSTQLEGDFLWQFIVTAGIAGVQIILNFLLIGTVRAWYKVVGKVRDECESCIYLPASFEEPLYRQDRLDRLKKKQEAYAKKKKEKQEKKEKEEAKAKKEAEKNEKSKEVDAANEF